MAAHILIIDDDVGDRLAWATILRRAGYRVTTARDGRTAIDLMGSVTPDSG